MLMWHTVTFTETKAEMTPPPGQLLGNIATVNEDGTN